MAEVGVLQLTIQDNSDKAARGLDNLSDALVRVKHAVTGGLGLEGVADEVVNLHNIINSAKGTSSTISKLGTMFNAINKFSQLKGFNLDSEQIRDYASSLMRVANAQDKIQSSIKENDWRSGMAGGADSIGQAIEENKKEVDTFEDTVNRVKEIARGSGNLWGTFMRMGAFATYGGSKSSSGQSGMDFTDLQKQTENLTEVESQIQSATGSIKEAFERERDAITETTDAQVKLNEAGEAYAGIISIFDQASGAYKQMYIDTSEATEGVKNLIDLTQIPASGKNGVFANAAEEAAYLTEKVEEAKASQQQWLSINDAATKQLKYGGPTNPDELLFNQKYSEEGYYSAIEAEEQYKNGLSDLLSYAKEYTSTAKDMASATSDVTNATKAQTDAVQQATTALAQENEQMRNVASAVQTGTQTQPVVETTQRSPWTADDVSNLVNYYTQVELLEMKYNEMLGTLAADVEANKLSKQQIAERAITIQNLKEKIEALKNTQDDATESTWSFGKAWGSFKSGLKSAFPLLSELASRLKSIIIRRTLTAALRKIVSGAKEGIENVYYYSKAIGSNFAPSMDSAASSIATMKNAIGAALAPALTALIPTLNTIVSGFINAVNYVNQFFSLLNGQSTWTKAIDQTTTAYKDNTDAAKSASKATKDLLADWDELNIIQSSSSSGTSGATTSATTDYSSMFEEVSEFSEEVKSVVSWIQDHLDLIKSTAKAIGIAILGWKLSKVFSTALSTLGSIALGATGIVVGLQLAWDGAYNAGLNGGFDGTTMLTTAAGILSTTIGGALIGFKIGGVWGAVIGGAAGLIASISVAYSAYMDGERTRKLMSKWNAKEQFTDAEISEYVRRSFNFDIEATIDKINLITTNSTISAKDLNNKITTFNSKYVLAKIKAQINADDSETAMEELKTSADDVIKAFNARVDNVSETVKTSIEILPLVKKDGEKNEQDVIDNLLAGNQELKDYMTGLGTDIANAYNEAVIAHWGEGTEEAYLAQIERLNKIIQRKEEYVSNAKLQRSKEVTLENMNYQSAEKANEEIEKWSNEYIEAAKEALKTRSDSNYELAGYWQSVIDDLGDQYTNGKITKEEYFEKRDKYIENMNAVLEAADADAYWIDHIEEYLNSDLEEVADYKEAMEQFKQKWIEVFKGNEGYDITKYAQTGGSTRMDILKSDYKSNPNAREGLVSSLIATLNATGKGSWAQGMVDSDIVSKLSQSVRESNGTNWAEIMTESDIKAWMNYLVDNFDMDFAKTFVDKLDVSDEVKQAFYKYLPYGSENGPDAYNYLKEAVKDGLSTWEIESLRYRYPDIDDATLNQMLNDLGVTIDKLNEYGGNDYQGNATTIRPMGYLASAGMSDVGWGAYNPQNAQQGVGQPQASISTDVATGTAQGNEEQNGLINQLITLVNRIANKDFTVTVSPSSSWGNFNGKSNREFSKVTGR